MIEAPSIWDRRIILQLLPLFHLFSLYLLQRTLLQRKKNLAEAHVFFLTISSKQNKTKQTNKKTKQIT